MDYKTLKSVLAPCISDHAQELEAARKTVEAQRTQGPFDKRVVTVLNNLLKTLEVSESFKRIIRNILAQEEYFCDTSVHHTSKAQQLKQILDDNGFLENNKQYNLSTLQTYVENILTKQLLEINIKIEENQRILHNIEASKPSGGPKAPVKPRYTKYLFIENERVKYTIRYASIVEILKIGKGVAEKNLTSKAVPYSKVSGMNRRNVMKRVTDYKIQKNQPLNNYNLTLPNTVEKMFAVITRRDSYLNIFFVDNILYTDPVEAQDMGGYAKTFEGNYKTIEV
ncbi:MAG: hypothetical protein D3926_06915 [Desulfobacteraceae bacterium]|nr:MAG: hypothetical protein D3926_06915 [Desulfobacteraceae bacterium]